MSAVGQDAELRVSQDGNQDEQFRNENNIVMVWDIRRRRQVPRTVLNNSKLKRVDTLTKKGLQRVSGESRLHNACRNRSVAEVEEKLRRENFQTEAEALEFVNSENRLKMTPLHVASSLDKMATCIALLEAGADVTLKDSRGWLPVMLAVQNGHKKLVKFLLKKNMKTMTSKTNDLSTLLHIACTNGHLDIVSFLVKSGAPLEERDKDGDDSLMVATYYGKQKVVDFLLRNGVSVQKSNVDGRTCLHHACQEGHKELVMKLLQSVSAEERAAFVNQLDKNGVTALGLASGNGYHEISKMLLEHGAAFIPTHGREFTDEELSCVTGDVEQVQNLLTRDSNRMASFVDENGSTLLHLVASGGENHVMVAEILKENNVVNLDAVDHQGDSALIIASACGGTRMANWIVENGGKVDIVNNDGKTALHYASLEGHEKMVELLLAKEGSSLFVNQVDKDGSTALHLAATSGHEEICRRLLENDGHPAAVDNQGFIPLQCACRHGHLDAMMMIWDAVRPEVALSARDSDGNTLLHSACIGGHLPMMKQLIDNGIVVNAVNKRGNNAIMMAAFYGRNDIVEWLLSEGFLSDVERDSDGRTALHHASQEGHVTVLETLLAKFPESVNYQDNRSSTALHLASENGDVEVCQKLLINGADCCLKNDRGLTPIMSACVNGKVAVVKLLMQNDDRKQYKTDVANKGYSLMQLAYLSQHQPMIDLMIEEGISKDHSAEFADLLIRSGEIKDAEEVEEIEEVEADKQGGMVRRNVKKLGVIVFLGILSLSVITSQLNIEVLMRGLEYL